MREYWNDTKTTYIKNPIAEKDPLKVGVGALMALTSIPFELPDYAAAGIANESVKAPTGTRTWRDIKSMANNNVRHPIRTVLGGLRLIGDVPRDGIDLLFGFRHGTRSQIQHTLN